MKSRAKCKACGDIVESKKIDDFVSCRCGEVMIGGGENHFRATFKNKETFVIIDDEGNEIIPKVAHDTEELEPFSKPSKQEMIGMLDEMVKKIEEMPREAMLAPVTHADYCSLLILLSAILRSD